MGPADLEVISTRPWAAKWRTGLTRDVTHLFAHGPSSDKYKAAMQFQAGTDMKVILPHLLTMQLNLWGVADGRV